MKMRLPAKNKRGNSLLKSKSELSRQEVKDILKISKIGGGKTRTDNTGHKTLSFLPDKKWISENAKIPITRLNKLIKKGYIDDRFGFITTISAFIHVWLYFGANPFE